MLECQKQRMCALAKVLYPFVAIMLVILPSSSFFGADLSPYGAWKGFSETSRGGHAGAQNVDDENESGPQYMKKHAEELNVFATTFGIHKRDSMKRDELGALLENVAERNKGLTEFSSFMGDVSDHQTKETPRWLERTTKREKRDQKKFWSWVSAGMVTSVAVILYFFTPKKENRVEKSIAVGALGGFCGGLFSELFKNMRVSSDQEEDNLLLKLEFLLKLQQLKDDKNTTVASLAKKLTGRGLGQFMKSDPSIFSKNGRLSGLRKSDGRELHGFRLKELRMDFYRNKNSLRSLSEEE